MLLFQSIQEACLLLEVIIVHLHKNINQGVDQIDLIKIMLIIENKILRI